MNYKLEAKIEAVKQMSIDELCEKFKCSPEEICLGDYIARNTNDTVCPYKVILGFANFENSQVRDLGPLEIVYGRQLKENGLEIKDMYGNPIYCGINLKNSRVYDLGNLRKVYGSCSLGDKITSTGNLEFLGSNLYLNHTKLKTIDSNLIIDGRLNVEDCILESFGGLKKARVLYINSKKLRDFGDLEMVKYLIVANGCSEKVNKLIQKNLVKENGVYVRAGLQTTINN